MSTATDFWPGNYLDFQEVGPDAFKKNGKIVLAVFYRSKLKSG